MGRGPEWSIAKELETQGFGTYGTDIFAGEMPQRPDNVIVVFRTIGGRVVNDVQEDIILEIETRNVSYETAFDTAQRIGNFLHRAQGDLGGQGIIMRVRADSTPTPAGRDSGQSGGRWSVVQTFTAVLKQGKNLTP